MVPAIRAIALLILTGAGTAVAQVPVLAVPAGVVYPPIARAAHIQGKVVVDFSIDGEGRTTSVRAVSGSAMLSNSLEARIASWRFQTPLPPTAETDFAATYTFGTTDGKFDLDDDLDAPPYVPCCGDSIRALASSTTVIGEVRSLSGDQQIDVSATAPAIEKDRCPEDRNRLTPTRTAPDDFVELERPDCVGDCGAYRVHVYRNGLIAWHGEKGTAAEGDRAAQIGFPAAEKLLDLFATDSFWHACSVQLPSTLPDEDGDVPARIPALTVRIGGSEKTVNFEAFSFADETAGPKLAWAVDKAADTHRWRHGDAASESFDNMRQDIELPKAGITKLIRATWRFNPFTATLTLEPLKHFLADGVDLDVSDESGWTALMYAAALDPTSPDGALALLLSANATVDKASLHGDTALETVAYTTGNLSTLLLDHGAQINHANADGVTVLMLLATQPRVEEIRKAIARGADITAQDRAGRIALDYLKAAACGHPIVPLPKAPMQQVIVTSDTPPPCPPDAEAYRTLVRLLTPRPQRPEVNP